MFFFAAALGGLGLASLLMKRTLMGMLVGVQLLVLSSTTAFVLGGVSSGEFLKGYVFALFIVIGGVAQLVVGWALAVRLFYLRGNDSMQALRKLRG